MKVNEVIIDGFKCYAPQLANKNDGFDEKSFEVLFQIEESNFWFCSRNRMIKDLILKFNGRFNYNFLEVGSGTGIVLTELSKCKNIKLFGSDIYLSGLKFASKRLPKIEFIQMDASDIPFTEKFDAIGAFDVVEHIKNDKVVFENLYKALKNEGYLYLTVPQYKFLWSYLDEIAFHKRRYSKQDLFSKIENSGFTIKYCTSYLFTLFPVMLISRILLKLTKKAEFNDGFKEFKINKYMNQLFNKFMLIDEWLIKNGFSLPFGGSLVIVAQKKLP